MAFVNERMEDGQWQTIDRERQVILTKVSGPDKEGNYNCEIIYNGKIIKFYATSGMKIHGKPKLGEDRKYEMNWQIDSLFIPQDIQGKKAEIMDIITDALVAWGWNYRPEKAHSVHVQFLPSIV